MVPADEVRNGILRLFRAVKAVSKESSYGVLHEMLSAGLVAQYTKADLEVAYVLYKEVI